MKLILFKMSELIKLLEWAGQTVDEFAIFPAVKVLDSFPVDQVRLFVLWFALFPVGWFFHFCVRGATARHLTNLVLGFLGSMYFFGWSFLHIVLMSSVTWLLMAFAPRDQS